MTHGLQSGTTVYRFNRKWPGEGRPWSFGANKYKLFDCSRNDGSLVVNCTMEDGSIIRFVVPIGPGTNFARDILPRLGFDRYNRCTFEISQETYEFTWRYRIHMDGRPYLTKV